MKLQSLFEVLSTHGMFLSFSSVCVLSFWHTHLRMSRDPRVSLVELDKYLEKTQKKEWKENQERKESQRTNNNQANDCCFLGDVKLEVLQEELRQRELMDLGGEKSFPFLFSQSKVICFSPTPSLSQWSTQQVLGRCIWISKLINFFLPWERNG